MWHKYDLGRGLTCSYEDLELCLDHVFSYESGYTLGNMLIRASSHHAFWRGWMLGDKWQPIDFELAREKIRQCAPPHGWKAPVAGKVDFAVGR